MAIVKQKTSTKSGIKISGQSSYLMYETAINFWNLKSILKTPRASRRESQKRES